MLHIIAQTGMILNSSNIKQHLLLPTRQCEPKGGKQ